jgi:hypothetical protein
MLFGDRLINRKELNKQLNETSLKITTKLQKNAKNLVTIYHQSHSK